MLVSILQVILVSCINFFALIIINFKLQNLDVDPIIKDRFQSSFTPRPSIPKFPPFTPAASNGVAACEDISLPPELCVECSHGFKACNQKYYLNKSHIIIWIVLDLTFEIVSARNLPRSCKPFANYEG